MFSSRTSNHNHHQHHHHPNHHPHRGPPRTGDGGGSPVSIESAMATDIFEQFVAASTFKSVLHHFRHMCDVLKLRPQNIRNFYPKLRSKIRSWKAQAIWSKFDKRMSPKCYNHGKACSNTKVLIIGAGPCGLRSAIEAQLLGAKVVVIEKRDRFSRNNVLHLWPFVIADLKALGAKKFYGKFCAGAIDHISIRQLQCMLLKAALLLGVEVFEAVTFEQLLEPPEDQSQTKGWHAQFSPSDHPVNQYEFDVLIGADGKRNTLLGFKRKEFRGKLAIAITANFINKHTELEARVQEISGVAFIFNQKFFKDLYADTGIDLENIVYYKDDTHYFVMTAKKHSLINKGVILRDLPDTQQLLHPNNVDRKALCDYAREAADFSTGYQLPHLDFAVNHYGKPDIAMFDFTSMFAAENACRVVRKNGHSILQCLVGDSLLEPFWPTGSGCARGFLSCFDACWAIRSWGSEEMTPLEVVAERESVYRLLAQTTPENLSKDFSSYTVQPSSRYPTVNTKSLLPFQVCHLYVTDDPEDDGGLNSVDDALSSPLRESADVDAPRKRKRKDSRIQPDAFLSWCQKQVEHNEQIKIEDFDSFKDGRILCTILHRYRPDLVDVDNLDHISCSQRCQLAFNVLEKEFGIKPIMSGSEMVEMNSEERLNVASYISQIHDALRGEIPRVMGSNPPFKVHKGQSNFDDFEDFPVTNEEKSVNDNHHCTSLAHRGREHVERAPKEDGISLTKEGGLQQKRKHRSNSSLDANAYQRRLNISQNREERLRKQKEQRELDTVRFIRAMRMLHCDLKEDSRTIRSQQAFSQDEDYGLQEYRKNSKTMKEKATELEMKLYFPDKLEDEKSKEKVPNNKSTSFGDRAEDFSDKVKGLEAKFRGTARSPNSTQQRPKDLMRAVGKLEKTDWNLCAIEKKIKDNMKPVVSTDVRERVPKWSQDVYNDKYQNIERRLRENGENEERIAKYLDIDASLKRLERKLREGSTLETGLRGNNKVSNLASQLSSKLTRKESESSTNKTAGSGPKQTKQMVLPTGTSDLCYFCGTRVYLVERLCTEGKYFHRQCFKCNYCGAFLRLGNYIYDRENRYGGKFFCIPHFGLTVKPKSPNGLAQFSSKVGSETASSSIRKDARRSNSLIASLTPGKEKNLISNCDLLSPSIKMDISLDRGDTPERVEFENSVVEHSDEEEYLSEDEWTDRNFGASANELDDDDSDYSDLSDDEIDENALFLDAPIPMSADETRRLAETWKIRYSTDGDRPRDRSLFSESDLGEMSEHGVEGDESFIPTEGEIGDDDDDDQDDDEHARLARELRRQELNINVSAPPRVVGETSDSESDTEIGSESESDTQIDTDSEFEEDNQFNRGQIPKIVIDEMPKEVAASTAPGAGTSAALSCSEQEDANEPAAKNLDEVGYPKSQYISQVVELNSTNLRDADSTPQSDGLSNLTLGKQVQAPNPHSEHLKRLLQRTESTEAFSAQRSILKREYLLGNASSAPKKSVSSTDLGNRFKSFMDKISETQKKLNPAPEPSPSMQAFLNLSNKNDQAMTYKSESFSFNKTSPFLRSSLSAASVKQESCFEKREENSGVIDEHAAGSLSSSSEKSDDEGKLITFSSTGGSSVGKNGNIIREQRISKLSQSSPSSSSFNEDATTIDLKGEKGALDSAQSEKTSNSAISERIEGVNESNLDDCFGESLEMKDFSDQENNVEALNLQLVSSENIKNSECSTEISSSNCAVNVPNDFEVGEIEGIFDKLAEEAINALEVESFSPTILEDTSEDDQKGTCRPNSVEDELHIAENKTNLSENENFIVEKSGSFELKSSQGESSSQSDCFGLSNKDKTTDESGFKSIEDNKGDLSDTEQCLLVQDDYSKKDSEATLSTNSVTLKNSEKFAARTEADLSDWAEDSDAAVSGTLKTPESESSLRSPSALNDLLTLNPFSGSTKGSNMNLELNIVPRFASQESLGDSDSAISLGLVKTAIVSSTSKLAAFAESEDFDYADLSTNEASPDGGQTTIEYKKLENDSPCSPIQTSDFTNDKHTAPTASASNMSVKGGEFKDQSSKTTPHSCRSDEAFSESLIKDPLKSPGRYEGYFPRFKDRKAFNFVRDSIDVRKCSSVKPLFTPSKEDILQREENEKQQRMNFFASDASPSPPSISSSSSTSVGSCAPKNKVGDVVKDMVLSRMNSKNLDKDRRRSRSAISPLRQGSNSSLVTPESDIHTSKLNSPKEGFSPLKMQQFSLYSASKDSSSSLGGEFNNNTDGNSENILSRSPSDVKMRDTCGNVFSVNFKASDQFKSGIGIENRNFYKSSPQLHLSTSHQLSTSPNFEPHSETFVSEIPVGSKIENSSKTCSSNPFNRRLSEGELRRPSILTVVGDGFSNNAKPQGFGRVKKDPNERLKELLEERRRKGQGDESKEAKLRNKNFCLKECLEEYRQKRCSAPVFPPEPPLVPTVAAESNQKDVLRAKLNLPLGERYYNRPSLLELESMQIFSCNSNRSLREKPSTNTQDANRPRASSFSWNKTPSNAGHATTHNAIPPSSLYPESLSSSLANPNEEQTTTGLSTVSSKNNHEMTPSDQHTAAKGSQLYFPASQDAASTPTGQKRSKKKDRERRRSLIQFVAGLFSKSDEKERDAPEADNIESNSSSPKERTKSRSSTHETPVTPSTSPDSGPTMKGRLSKFRLSRSKERRKEESVELKSRSASVGSHLSCEMSLEPSAASSLPSTPSRSLFSFLSTSPEKIKRPSPSEEKDSEDDSPLASVTAKQSSASSSISTPSQRRQKAAQRAAKQAEQKRLRMAQEVQRQMEECEVKMRELEEKGIAVEKSLIGETKEGSLDEMLLMKEWFSLVREKNSLVRSQDQLGIKARELELEDRHVRLENELRQRMTSSEREKTREDIDREGTILTEIIAIIDEKDTLDTLLEDDRQRYAEEDRDLEQIYARKFSSLHKNAEKETGV